ncbi:MAG: hypothetical protein LBL94_00565 [Prevotellaceae bacterium]|jgi:hypothetical protein|nr:hypothetical protein [Prevotellaceae bacterium]
MPYIYENSSNPMDFFQRYPHKVKVINLQVDMKIQMEYFELLSEVFQGRNAEALAVIPKENAFNLNLPLDYRKRMLAWLSSSEEVDMLRELEQYEKNCPDDVKGFVSMCVYQCRTNLESALLGEHHAVVASGMGGEGNKVRYFAALITLSGEAWNTTEQHLLREELKLASKALDAVVEQLEFSGKYAKMLILAPITLSPVAVIHSAKDASNALGDFISPQEVVTNVARLSDEELDGILKKGGMNFE